MLITDGAHSQIKAKDTTLIGGLIANATRNEDGTLTDHGQLNLTTETLTVSDLQDKSESEQSGWGFQTSTGRSIQSNKDGSTTTRNGNTGTTTVSLSSEGHKKEGETQATLGHGNVTVGGKSAEDSHPELNRDVNQAQITTLDQQTAGLSTSLTADNRWLTEEGRKMMEAEHKKLAADVVTGAAKVGAAATAAVTDSGQIGNAWNMVGKGQDLAYANDGKTAAKIEAVSDGEVKAGQTAQAIVGEMVGTLNPDGTQKVRVTEGMNAYGAYNKNGDTIYVEVSAETRGSIVNTAAHEVMHAKGANETTATVTGYMTDLAYQANAWANSDQIQSARSQMVFAPVNAAADEKLIASNNMAFRDAEDRGQLEHRQLKRDEASQLDQARAAIDTRKDLSADQKQQEKNKLTALACAQVKCAEGVSEKDPLYAGLKALQDKGNELQQQGNDLKTALASNGVQSSAESFTYTDWDAKGDWLSSRERGLGIASDALKLGAGIASASAGAGLAAGGCSSAVLCPLAAGGAALLVGQGARDINAGVQGLLTPHEYEWGQNVYASFSGETYIRERDPLMETALALGVSAIKLGASLGISRLASGGNNVLSANLRPKSEVPKSEVPGSVVGDAAKGASELTFGRKLDFLFNKGIDQSNAYNAARAAGNAERIGIADTAANRAEVARLFNQAFRDPSSIVGPGKLAGSNLREFFLPGVTGTGSKIQFVEQSGKVVTIIAK